MIARNEPVTVVAKRQVKPGHESQYEAWLTELTTAAHELSGYLGAEFHRPAKAGDPWISVFRFATLADLEAFERSELRSRMIAKVIPHVESDAIWQRMTGLEFWFEPPPGTVVAQPSPHRMALLLILVVFVLVLALNLVLGPLIASWPMPARILLTVTLQVLLMTYLIMPRLTRMLARWIYPATRTTT